MAKGQDYSRHQRKIIDRYYDNLDTITLTKLQELVSNLFLAEGKKAETLWKRAETLLAKTDARGADIRATIEKRDIQKFAQIVSGAGFKGKK